ncbi:winged helix-turn-helix domain-containing protein [Streptomyces sp. CB01881]|uniref:winged helix-turn-helix domain-containing protein n=1 Tax=Streptomyces sp. CB01881 TaxID=2078691 RepID=UPI000CDC396E|nr:winged helix-turn-helix domain-containing protein [Streptomyces sp. CB01881]AUY48931.1 transcriptional regulator [Streptomyces sp. CB01881]TYC77420.1 winged helix family transcriptional regulator [Streptomyces sp. CB01881]
MSSSSTATLPLPAATPHLRAVRSVPSTAERWHGQHPAGPQHPAAPQQPSAQPHPVAAPAHPAAGAVPGVPAPQALLAALPEGATVVAALPQGALPQALLAQYGAQFGAQFGSAGGHPMVGYLVLVPAENGSAPAGPTAVAAASTVAAAGAARVPSAGPAAVRPVRPTGRGITVDVERRNAYVDGRLLDLTYLEFELLAHLTEHPQRVHTRDHLVSAVWGYGHVGDGRTVDVHVARLRRKLGSAYRDSIVTVRRVGYKYAPVA